MPKKEIKISISLFSLRLYGLLSLNPFSFDIASPDVSFESLPTILLLPDAWNLIRIPEGNCSTPRIMSEKDRLPSQKTTSLKGIADDSSGNFFQWPTDEP